MKEPGPRFPHDEEREHSDRADEKIGHRIAGAEKEHKTADQRSCRCTDIVARGEPAETRAASSLGEARYVGCSDRREDRGRKAVNKAEGEQRPGIANKGIEERR